MAALPDLQPVEGKYEILQKLREGGMGAIYLVRHRLLHELRVVKVLRSQLRDERDLRERFVREARTAIQLRHPNVAQLYEFEVDADGTAYMVLEYIEGRTLEDVAAAPGTWSLRLKLEIVHQCLRALGFLHRKGFVHRDIAPDNIMLTRDQDGHPLAKLLDLGIVKALCGDDGLTGTAVFVGKVRYASPEQLEHGKVDPRTDLYSLAVVLYEILTGLHPFPGHDLRSVMSGHLFKPPVPFEVSDPGRSVPEDLRTLVLDGLEKERESRLASAEEFRRRIEALASWREPLDTVELGGGSAAPAAAATPSATSAQHRLDERFDADRSTPVPEGSDALERERAAAAQALRRRVRDLLDEQRLEEARWLVLGEAWALLPAQEAEALGREIDWQETQTRTLQFEIAHSCALSALAGGDLEAARRSWEEARRLLPGDPRLRDLQARMQDPPPRRST
jgi:serine/threonine-protein kinase